MGGTETATNSPEPVKEGSASNLCMKTVNLNALHPLSVRRTTEYSKLTGEILCVRQSMSISATSCSDLGYVYAAPPSTTNEYSAASANGLSPTAKLIERWSRHA